MEETKSLNVFLGIDPGFTGGLALVNDFIRDPQDESWLAIYPFNNAEGKGDAKRISLDALKVIANIHAISVRVFIEHVHAMPKQGVSSMFRFGREYGRILGALEMMGIEPVLVRPQAWQAWAYRGISGKGKERSIKALQKIMGDDLSRFTLPGCRVPHMGMVEATLIALYGKAKHEAEAVG